MSRIQAQSRILVISTFFTLPLAIAGALLFPAHLRGAAAGVGLGLIVTFFLSWLGERALLRGSIRMSELPAGLRKSYEYALDQYRLKRAEFGQSPQRPPRLGVVPDPQSNAFVIRGIASPGTILVTQGLLARLDEDEMRAVLGLCVNQAEAPGIVVRTLASFLALCVLSAAPRSWVQLALTGDVIDSASIAQTAPLSPLSALRFWMIFPIIRVFLRYSRPVGVSLGSAHHAPALQSAFSKILKSPAAPNAGFHPSLTFLGILDRASDQFLFRI